MDHAARNAPYRAHPGAPRCIRGRNLARGLFRTILRAPVRRPASIPSSGIYTTIRFAPARYVNPEGPAPSKWRRPMLQIRGAAPILLYYGARSIYYPPMA